VTATTIWIVPTGQVINVPPNGHYQYISENFQNIFGRQPLNESEVHDAPYSAGWVHIQSHHGAFNVRGDQNAISRNRGRIRDMIFNRLMEDRSFSVNIEYNNKAMINPNGAAYRFSMPDQYEDLRHYLG
jgi:hypothetical protein